jgi:hypothetical protein
MKYTPCQLLCWYRPNELWKIADDGARGSFPAITSGLPTTQPESLKQAPVRISATTKSQTQIDVHLLAPRTDD